MINSALAQAVLTNKYLVNLNNLVAWPARTGIQRVCYEFCSRWPFVADTIPFVECGPDKISLLSPDFFKDFAGYFEEEDSVLAALIDQHGVDLPETSPGWFSILSARNRIVCEVSVADALKYCRCVISLEESLNLDFYSLAAKLYPEKIFNLCHDFLAWTHSEFFHIDWRHADNVCLSISNRRKYTNNFFTATATRDQYVKRINRGDTREYAVIPPGADGLGRTFRQRVPNNHEFVVVGTLEPRKQCLPILDAFVELQASGIDAKLTFAGRMGWLKPEDKERLLDAFDKYAWLRWVDSPTDGALRDIMSHCRATIYLSEAEGFGSPPVESLALGVPCIVSSVIPSVLDMDAAGQIRLLPGDRFGLLQAVRRLMNDTEVALLQSEIQTLALPTWQGFVDGVADLVLQNAPPVKHREEALPPYGVILSEIQVLARMWEVDRETLIRSLFAAAAHGADAGDLDRWVIDAQRANWSPSEVVLRVMNALPSGWLPVALASAAIDRSLQTAFNTIAPDFSDRWKKTILELLEIDSPEIFELAIYRRLHKREPGEGELHRAALLRRGEVTHIQLLQEAVGSEEFASRLLSGLKSSLQRDGIDEHKNSAVSVTVEWIKQILRRFSEFSAVDRCLRLPSDEDFLVAAYQDIAGSYPPNERGDIDAKLVAGRLGRIRVLLDMLLSQGCLRRILETEVHLALIHRLAAEVGVRQVLNSAPLCLATKANWIQTLPLSRLHEAPKILLDDLSETGQAIIKVFQQKHGSREDLIAGLLLHGVLSGQVDPENLMATWAALHLSATKAFRGDIEGEGGDPVVAFRKYWHRVPDSEEKVVLSGQDGAKRQVAYWAVLVASYRRKFVVDVHSFLVNMAWEFENVTAAWGELQVIVSSLDAIGIRRKVEEPLPVIKVQSEGGAYKASVASPIYLPTIDASSAVVVTTIDQLLAFEGEEFICQVYRCLLNREPDAGGLSYYLDRLNSGRSKESLVYQIASGPEGREAGVNLKGLDRMLHRQRRLSHPFWGTVLNWFDLGV